MTEFLQNHWQAVGLWVLVGLAFLVAQVAEEEYVVRRGGTPTLPDPPWWGWAILAVSFAALWPVILLGSFIAGWRLGGKKRG